MAYIVFALLCLAVLGLLFGIVSLLPPTEWHSYSDEFDEIYPAISDEEFVQRLSPEVPPEIGLKVRGLMAEIIGINESQIYPEAGLLELMGDAPPRFDSTPSPRSTT